jgi:flagellar basal body-associated protein FliL
MKRFFIRTSNTSSNTNSSYVTGNSNHSGSPSSKFKKLIPVALIVIIVGIIIVISTNTLRAVSGRSNTNSDSRVTIQDAKAKVDINKEYAFPINDAEGNEVTRLKYTVENAELRDEIIVKGTRANAVKGRTFLVLNLKLVNEYDKPIQINARDYVRLSVNGNNEELLAADIHNDPVSVQPISTKTTRLGFPINDSDRNLILKAGEIAGSKEDIQLNFAGY